MLTPKITTIIPTFRRPYLVQRAIHSILQQSEPAFQIVVIDNASGDETVPILRRLAQKDARIQLIEQKENVGITRNFITGLQSVRTPYVTFLPDDDFVAPSLFEEGLQIFARHPDIAFCGGGGAVFDGEYRFKGIDQDGQQIPRKGLYAPPDGYFTYLETTFGITFPSLLFRTEVLRKLGGIDPRIHFGIDEDLVGKCSATHPIFLLTDSLTYFACHHTDQLSRAPDFTLQESDCLHLRENIAHLIDDERVASFFEKRLCKIWSTAFAHFYREKDYPRAAHYAHLLFQKTGQGRWRRKEREMHLPSPVIYCHDLLKKIERTLRKKRGAKPTEIRYHPDSQKWKTYAHYLEEKCIQL